jgi:hypothetical protein
MGPLDVNIVTVMLHGFRPENHIASQNEKDDHHNEYGKG